MAGDEINKTNFLISLNGEIQSAFFPFFDDVYCKYCFVWGPDWIVISGIEEGISQISKKGRDEEQLFIWNLPLSISFKATNPFGWPQLVVSTYGLDAFGNEVVRGYGICHIPIAPGPCEKEIPMFVPDSSSILQKFTSWLTGRRPEFIDPRILSQGDMREGIFIKYIPNLAFVLGLVLKFWACFLWAPTKIPFYGEVNQKHNDILIILAILSSFFFFLYLYNFYDEVLT